MTLYRLCKLRKGSLYQVAMLPSQYAVRNCLVKLRYVDRMWRGEREPWEQDWRVDYVYHQTASTEQEALSLSKPPYTSKKGEPGFYLPEVELSDPPKTLEAA